MTVDVLDERYFLINLLLTVGLQMVGFGISAATKSEKLFDLFGGLNFIAVAIMTMALQGSYNHRAIACVTIVCVSRAWLAGFLAFRALIRKGDARFDNVRGSTLALLLSFCYQIVWVYAVSAPVIFILGSGDGNGDDDFSGMSASDWVGTALGAAGCLVEIAADIQKYRFRADPSNALKLCNEGLWSLSRHPNYLGEVVLWWGLFVLGITVFREVGAGWSTIVSPLFTTSLLLFGSGIPTAEGSALKRFYSTPESTAACQHYLESTPPLFCCCCGLYRIVPQWMRLVCCCELPMYRYVPEGAQAEAQVHLNTDESTSTQPGAPGQKVMQSRANNDEQSRTNNDDSTRRRGSAIG